jgi:hypothetical protein
MHDSSVAPGVAARFMLDADEDVGLLSRVLEPFAKRGLVPDRMWSHRGADSMHVEVALHDAPPEMLHLIEGNLRQVVGLRRLTLLRRTELAQAA